MLTVPVTLTRLIVKFAPQFSKRVWEHVQVLVVGALLAPGQRTVTAVLRVMRLSQERHFQNYHRVLNRARWSTLTTARVLLELVVHNFAPTGVVVIGLDDTLEPRRGQQIKAKGIYRDPVRSSRSHMVKASGLRWLCAMVLAEIPVGPAGMGLAVSHGAVSLAALSSTARAAPQELAAVGGPTHWTEAPLAARTAAGRGD
jgi:DDE superfamily endonuclease